MARYGYSYLSDKQLLSFLQSEMERGEWGKIDTSKYQDTAQLPPEGLLDLPVLLVFKLWLFWALSGLARTLGILDTTVLLKLDEAWDSFQRQLHFQLAFFAAGLDQAKKEAALRLREVMLLGDGLAQTRLSYDDEADFGYRQIALSKEEGHAKDIALLGIEPLFESILASTSALEKGLGRTPGDTRRGPRSKRVEAALNDCRATCLLVHKGLERLSKTTPAGPQKEMLEKLLAPLVDMLGRGQRPENNPEAEEEETTDQA